jgi:hypothetical protein
MKYGIIFWGNSSDSRKVFTLQKKIVRKILVESYLRDYRSYLSHMNIYFHHETSLEITKSIFRQIQLYTVLTQKASTIFIDQLLT